MDDVITPEALPDVPHVSTPDGDGAEQSGSISLDELKAVLGKDFKDPASALKSIKDTYSYVGSQATYKERVSKLASALNTDEQGVLTTLEKLMENPTPTNEVPVENPTQPVATEGFVTRDQYQEDMFFSKNPNLEEVRDILKPLKSQAGDVSWDAFLQSDQAKRVVETFTGYKEVQAKRSVLESNPRLGAATDNLSSARQLMDEVSKAERMGDIGAANRAADEARGKAVSGVMEAFGL